MYIFLLDGDALGVNGTEIGIVEKADKEGFGGFLKGLDRLALPSICSVFTSLVYAYFSYLASVSTVIYDYSAVAVLTSR